MHLKKRLAAIGLLGAAGCTALYALAMRSPATPAPVTQAQETAPAAAVPHVAAQAETKQTRRVYPYSIVPGGVTDRRELTRVVVMDKVVATHYAAFETARATVRTVDKPRAVYVSYRKGDQVYWTAKKLQLAQGETLLSDGRNEIRTRCGNRISDVPQLPVEAKGPSAEELDSSVDVAQDGEAEGDVEEAGFAVDGNPAGQAFQLQTFASTATSNSGAPMLHNFGMNRFGSGIPDATWTGSGVPLYLVSKTSSVTTEPGTGTGTGTGGGSTGTPGGTGDPGTGGTPAGGTSGTTPDSGAPSTDTKLPTTLDETVLPSTDTGTKPSSPIPDNLLPPPTDLPGNTNDPGKTPPRQGNAPEPGSLWLGGAGVAALLAAR
ncbi:MAG: hypothetical protein JF619_28050, partial [Massilia sp.]|nr:hypothetical protein [Massilia sp.]